MSASTFTHRERYINDLIAQRTADGHHPYPSMEIDVDNLSLAAAMSLGVYLQVVPGPKTDDILNDRMSMKFTKDGRCKVKFSAADIPGFYSVITITNTGGPTRFREMLYRVWLKVRAEGEW